MSFSPDNWFRMRLADIVKQLEESGAAMARIELHNDSDEVVGAVVLMTGEDTQHYLDALDAAQEE